MAASSSRSYEAQIYALSGANIEGSN